MKKIRIAPFIDFIHGNRRIILDSRETILHLSGNIGDRSIARYDKLTEARDYITERFLSLGAKPCFESYTVDGKEYSNIIVEIPGKKRSAGEIIIIGAHYDTVENTPGANDNGTGIAALLELYRLLSRHKARRTIRLVAFTLEEPPFFSTEQMGSRVHACRCTEEKHDIKLMISIDMIGFAGRFVKQEFPVGTEKGKYPQTGDFLAVAALPSHSQYACLWKKTYNTHATRRNRIYEIIAPASVEGMNLSDHTSFHKNGFPSLLLTDTGFYRSRNYHSEQDTEATINYRFLAANIKNIFHTLKDIANRKELP